MRLRPALFLAVAVSASLMGAGAAWAQQGPQAPLWLPPGTSTLAPKVDGLYTFILWVTGITFVGVELLLIAFCVMYARRPGGKVRYTHGSNTAETIWTIAPAVMLLIIAVTQMGAWKEAKMMFPDAGAPDVVQVQTIGKQFKWYFRYAGEDRKFNTEDDLYSGDFTLPLGSKALMPIRSVDVIHSFYIPYMRVKQDLVPGIRNRVWFEPTGFYVAKVDPADTPYDAEFRKNGWKPSKEPPNFEWVANEQEFQARYGDKLVAINKYAYQSGKMRVFATSAGVKHKPTCIKGNQILESQDSGQVQYCIVPYEFTCAELCGQGHYTMAGTFQVLPKVAYDWWMEQQSVTEDASPDQTGTFKLWKD